MAYSPTNRDYHADSESHFPTNLLIAVVILGVATYCLSFGAVGDGGALGWYVRFAALAGLVAAFGMSAKARPHPIATAALAAMGFLDALSSMVTTTNRGWALTMIVVLTALQACAAVAALLLAPRPTAKGPATEYEAYVDYYNQAVRNYYAHQAQPAPPAQEQRGGYGQASAEAQAAPQVQRVQRPSQRADYADLDGTGSLGSAGQETGTSDVGRPAGLPSFEQAPASADRQRRDSGEPPPPSSSV